MKHTKNLKRFRLGQQYRFKNGLILRRITDQNTCVAWVTSVFDGSETGITGLSPARRTDVLYQRFWYVGLCHHDMTCPRIADGVNLQMMEGSCEYIE